MHNYVLLRTNPYNYATEYFSPSGWLPCAGGRHIWFIAEELGDAYSQHRQLYGHEIHRLEKLESISLVEYTVHDNPLHGGLQVNPLKMFDADALHRCGLTARYIVKFQDRWAHLEKLV